MARTIVFIPAAVKGGPVQYTLDEIPADVKREVEEMYEAGKTADGRFRLTFGSKKELLAYAAMAGSYAAQRPGGPIKFRKSPVRGLPDNVGEFRVTDIDQDSEDATAAIKEGVEALKAAGSASFTVPAAAPTKATGRSRR